MPNLVVEIDDFVFLLTDFQEGGESHSHEERADHSPNGDHGCD